MADFPSLSLSLYDFTRGPLRNASMSLLQRVSGFFGFQKAAAKGLARRRGANYAYIFVYLPLCLRLRLSAEICG